MLIQYNIRLNERMQYGKMILNLEFCKVNWAEQGEIILISE